MDKAAFWAATRRRHTPSTAQPRVAEEKPKATPMTLAKELLGDVLQLTADCHSGRCPHGDLAGCAMSWQAALTLIIAFPVALENEYVRRLEAQVAEKDAALKDAARILGDVAGDIEDGGSLDTLRGKYVMALVNARDNARAALSSSRSEAPE